MLPKIGIGVGVLVLNQGKILLGKRIKSHGMGTWQAPGGHLEHGETVQNCAIRELKEETGLLAETITLGPWKEIFFKEEGLHYLNLYVFVTKFSGQLTNMEPEKVENWDWFDPRSLPSPLFAALKEIAPHQSLDPFIQEHLLNTKGNIAIKAPSMV